MDGHRNYHAKCSQPYNETPTSNAFTDMWNLKKGQTELLCRTDADSQTLKNLWSPKETVLGVGGCAWVVRWKSCEIGRGKHRKIKELLQQNNSGKDDESQRI